MYISATNRHYTCNKMKIKHIILTSWRRQYDFTQTKQKKKQNAPKVSATSDDSTWMLFIG